MLCRHRSPSTSSSRATVAWQDGGWFGTVGLGDFESIIAPFLWATGRYLEPGANWTFDRSQGPSDGLASKPHLAVGGKGRRLLEANLSARPLMCPPPSWYGVLGTAGTTAGYPADEARSEAPIHGVSPIGGVACESIGLGMLS
jgi:hypothetical protein